MIFTVVYDRFDNPSGDRFRLYRLSADNFQNTGLARALQALSKPTEKHESSTNNTGDKKRSEIAETDKFEPVQHDLTGASHLLPDQLAHFKALLLEFDNVF